MTRYAEIEKALRDIVDFERNPAAFVRHATDGEAVRERRRELLRAGEHALRPIRRSATAELRHRIRTEDSP